MERTSKKLTRTDVQNFKLRLEAERQETVRLLAELEQERRQVTHDGPEDAGDASVTTLARESLFERTSQKNRQLSRINIALRRIGSGQFGVCSKCGEPINRKRLEAMPWTTYCLQCQEELERVHTSQSFAGVELQE